MTEASYKEIRECRVCRSRDLQPVLSLGLQKVGDFVVNPGDPKKPTAPLELVLCPQCQLLQLRHTVDAGVLFTTNWHRCIVNTHKNTLQGVVDAVVMHVDLKPEDVVLDVGTGDATLLGLYPKGIVTCGIDPSQQIMSDAALKQANFVARSFYSRQVVEGLAKRAGKPFKAITVVDAFDCLEDPVAFLQDMKAMLPDDGVLLIQVNYLATMLKNNAADAVYHERLAYYSFRSLEWALSRVGFAVVDAEVDPTWLRLVVKKAPAQRDDYLEGAVERIREVLEVEQKLLLENAATYLQFGRRVKQILEKVSVYVVQQTLKGKKCYAYGASSRAGTILQSVPIPLSGIAERDEAKVDKWMTATWLRVHDEEYVRGRANIMLVLPWYLRDEIVAREHEWMAKGGTLLFPLPKPVLVDKDGEHEVVNEPLKMLRKSTPVMVGHV
jgi:NDP-4-keto-2,6-dideoxyhexose 3-C-methyltransferase